MVGGCSPSGWNVHAVFGQVETRYRTDVPAHDPFEIRFLIHTAGRTRMLSVLLRHVFRSCVSGVKECVLH